jgi:hypothetical protein
MMHEPSPRWYAEEQSQARPGEADAEVCAAGIEAWSAWRQLLDAVQPEVDAALGDQAKLVERVQRRMSTRRTQRRRLSLAAAAALLACGGAAWFAAGLVPKVAAPPQPPVVARADSAAAASGDDGWGDESLDQELASTVRRAAALESQWRRPTDNLAYVRRQMDALEAEFNGDSL